jgi:hypothetical protein
MRRALGTAARLAVCVAGAGCLVLAASAGLPVIRAAITGLVCGLVVRSLPWARLAASAPRR